MWLEFGLDERDRLVSIEAVRRGKTQLRCPYCEGLLTAKKGKVKAWHFAHTDETCNQAKGIPTLPFYEHFYNNLYGLCLSEPAYDELLILWDEYGKRKAFSRPRHHRNLLEQQCIKHNPYRHGVNKWEFDRMGLIAVGGLSLNLFSEFQGAQLAKKRFDLEYEVMGAKRRGDHPTLSDALANLRLYRAQYQRVLARSLYFLEIKATGETCHKIGVTARPLDERISEIQRDLLPHMGAVEIKPLIELAHRGSIEHYFKWRYRQAQKPIGTFTEYFEFDDLKAVLRDLRRLGSHDFDFNEQEVMSQDFAHVKRSLLTRAGMMQAKKLGRPKPTPAQLIEQYPDVVDCLQQGLSLRTTSQATGRAINTIRKVKAAIAATP